MRWGILIQVVAVSGRIFRFNTRAMNPYVSQVPAQPCNCRVRRYAAPQQDFADASARLLTSHRAKADIDEGCRHVIFPVVCLGLPSRKGRVANLPWMSIGTFARGQRCSKVLRKRSILLKYSPHVAGRYSTMRLRISDAAFLPSANMQTSASQPGPSVGSR